MSITKVDLAISLLQDLIRTGAFRPGDRLPNEAELSAQLGVSRNSLREAIRAMQTMRILEARQGDGTYISDLDPAGMLDALRFAVDVSGPQAIIWFLEIRRMIEFHVAGIAAAKRTETELERLRDSLAQMAKAESSETMMEADTTFHERLAEIAGNPILTSLLRLVSGPTMRARIWRQQDLADVCAEHAMILRGIEARDVEAAKSAMWLHISGVLEWVAENPGEIESRTASPGGAG
ncbi:FadR/GntR family transcriptional regulator [Tropicimonas sediminicola]|uniref:Transcriptional regulator, GntR family n=1 Tax=Tropicimonas sediminicola TaxID=1031541 RepID=A0A239LP54_9RHOB|nr:FadR/GntR family transcriptional regulator [Tropicimonas sediminicola]SNT31593.1 transcriptional regulator, GntR family [Tropicimonas sediminicola]